VLYADHFGNRITSGTEDLLQQLLRGGRHSVEIVIGQQRISGIRHTFAEGAPGELVALVGSSGHLEIAVTNGNAARTLGLGPHAPVILRTAS